MKSGALLLYRSFSCSNRATLILCKPNALHKNYCTVYSACLDLSANVFRGVVRKKEGFTFGEKSIWNVKHPHILCFQINEIIYMIMYVGINFRHQSQ